MVKAWSACAWSELSELWKIKGEGEPGRCESVAGPTEQVVKAGRDVCPTGQQLSTKSLLSFCEIRFVG